MQFKTRGDAALYVWDYFYLANVPHAGDEKAWAAIERATGRIRESEIYLDAPTPADVRIRNARRVRNAVSVAIREIVTLSVPPDDRVIVGLAEVAAFCDVLIEALSESARRLVVD